jgi:hypothetical protein
MRSIGDFAITTKFTFCEISRALAFSASINDVHMLQGSGIEGPNIHPYTINVSLLLFETSSDSRTSPFPSKTLNLASLLPHEES